MVYYPALITNDMIFGKVVVYYSEYDFIPTHKNVILFEKAMYILLLITFIKIHDAKWVYWYQG